MDLVLDKYNVRDFMRDSADGKYKELKFKAMSPSVKKDDIIGVRADVLHKIADNMMKNGTWLDFVLDLPHKYFDENQLHVMIISRIEDFDFVINAVQHFLPYIDNPATCTQLTPRAFRKCPGKVLPYIYVWIKSRHIYTKRFAIMCLGRYFLDDEYFEKKYANMVASIKSKNYNINMAQALYFTNAVMKQCNKVFPYIKRLDEWTRIQTFNQIVLSKYIPLTIKYRARLFRKKLERNKKPKKPEFDW